MLWGSEEVQETLRMIGAEHLDIRTVTMGISLLGCEDGGREGCIRRIEEKIVSLASRLVEVTHEIEDMYGVPIVNRRISVTPLSLVFSGSSTGDFVEAALALERAAKRGGVDYIGGFSALVHKGATRNEVTLIESIPQVLKSTIRVCSSVNLATTKAGINMDAVKLMGEKIKETAFATENGSGCARLVVFANAVEDNPFIAGAFHGPGEDECVINIGVSGPGAVLSAIERLKRHSSTIDLPILAETIKRTAFKITRAGELVGREVVKRLGKPVKFGIVDLSLAPTPAVGDSVANILEAMGLEKTGAHGTTAALAMLVDAVKKGGVMASTSVGGLSGAFIPVSEDAGMVNAVKAGAMSIEKLEAMTSICSVGLDMVAIPGDTPAETISAIIADEMAIGVINNKTTAVRIIPVPGKHPGDSVDLGGLLGELVVMEVRNFDSSGFVNYGGQIPAPIQSLKN